MEILNDTDNFPVNEKKKCKLKCKLVLLFFFLIVFFISVSVSFFLFLFPAPQSFQTGRIFDIPKGIGIIEIAEILETEGFINSAESFIILDKTLSLLHKKKSMKAGKYVFKERKNLLEVYQKIASGESGIEEIRVTIIEGEPNFMIAKKISEKFKKISEDNFLKLAKNKEGYLYPDTYQFSPFVEESFVIETMEKNFNKKIEPLLEDIEKSGKTLEEIIIMASLVENEAGNVGYKTKQHIAGIIYNRLEKKMLLQIDAVFSYIYGYHIERVLFKHLEVDSPYNTYKYLGLPPGPIGNPGIKSIKAVLYPTKTRDLYYLTGKDGNFYYAQTGSQHNENIKKYR